MSLCERGELMFDDVSDVIGPMTRARDFAQTKLIEKSKVREGMGWSRVEYRGCVEGREAVAVIQFEGEMVARVELNLVNGTAMNVYEPTAERARQREHEQWMEERTGKRMTVRPMEMAGTKFVPGDDDGSWPRHIEFGWGEIISSLDPRSGGCSLVVRYSL